MGHDWACRLVLTTEGVSLDLAGYTFERSTVLEGCGKRTAHWPLKQRLILCTKQPVGSWTICVKLRTSDLLMEHMGALAN